MVSSSSSVAGDTAVSDRRGPAPPDAVPVGELALSAFLRVSAVDGADAVSDGMERLRESSGLSQFRREHGCERKSHRRAILAGAWTGSGLRAFAAAMGSAESGDPSAVACGGLGFGSDRSLGPASFWMEANQQPSFLRNRGPAGVGGA